MALLDCLLFGQCGEFPFTSSFIGPRIIRRDYTTGSIDNLFYLLGSLLSDKSFCNNSLPHQRVNYLLIHSFVYLGDVELFININLLRFSHLFIILFFVIKRKQVHSLPRPIFLFFDISCSERLCRFMHLFI